MPGVSEVSLSLDDGMLRPAAPLVSVIVPVHNHASFVEDSLDSIANSSYPSLEIVVVNDASEDDSDAVIRRWIHNHATERVLYIKHEENMGSAKTLNEAIRIAHGEILCFSSGDDMILPQGIAELTDYLMTNPDKAAVFADCHVIDEVGRRIYESGIEGLHRKVGMRKAALKIDELLAFNIFFHWAVCGPSLMLRKQIFNAIGFIDEQLALDDWDLFLKIAATGKLGFYDRYLGNYRLHERNTSRLHRSRLRQDGVILGLRYAHSFGGITLLHLAAFRALHRYFESKSRLGKVIYLTNGGALFLLSKYIHRAMGILLQLKHKYWGHKVQRHDDLRDRHSSSGHHR